MPRAYSLDLRLRVLALIALGVSRKAAAKHFAVSAATAIRWSARERDTGEVSPKAMGGKRPLSLAPHREWILMRIDAKSDLTLRGLVAELCDRGVPASYGAVQRFVRSEGLRFKKKPARKRAAAA
jgi:transposase